MILSFEEFAQQLTYGDRLMGLDIGSKTIGLALSDVTRTIASPMELVKRSKFTKDAQYILKLAGDQQVKGLVLGMPVNMDGSEGPRCQSTRQFAENILQMTDLMITYWDERLSTAAVTRTLIDADRSRARRKELVDKMAASYILQGALDRLQFMG